MAPDAYFALHRAVPQPALASTCRGAEKHGRRRRLVDSNGWQFPNLMVDAPIAESTREATRTARGVPREASRRDDKGRYVERPMAATTGGGKQHTTRPHHSRKTSLPWCSCRGVAGGGGDPRLACSMLACCCLFIVGRALILTRFFFGVMLNKRSVTTAHQSATAPSPHRHCTVTAPSVHRRPAVTTPSPHRRQTVAAPPSPDPNFIELAWTGFSFIIAKIQTGFFIFSSPKSVTSLSPGRHLTVTAPSPGRHRSVITPPPHRHHTVTTPSPGRHQPSPRCYCSDTTVS
jgi:hypothetical protein